MTWRTLVCLLACLFEIDTARAAEPERRPLPDYDGRGPRPSTPAQKALWIPRVLLSPVYFVSEYVVRRPLGAAVTAAERAKLPKALYDFFAFGPDHKAGIVPIGFIDFGFQPSVGLYAFWDDAGFKNHDLRLHGTTWGSDWLSATATERFRFAERLDLTLTGTATRRPDYAFYGLGPDTRESDQMRYSSDSIDAHMATTLAVWDSSALETAAGYRGRSFGHSNFESDPSVDDAQRGREPPGFVDGYRMPYARTRFVLDSRPRVGPETGVRLELSAEEGADLKNTPTGGFLRYGGTLGGFADLNDSGRVLSLAVSLLLADPLGARPVPFTELVTLGGPALMPGFRPGRLYDRSAAVAVLRYSWPIWVWLDGSLQVAMGNVFGEHLSGFSASRSRLSSALGIESRGSRDSVFQALVGFGSETFESGGRIDSLRITVGARNGF
jgi:hypothetical protein